MCSSDLKRLYPGGPECRLKGAYLIRCTGCVKDEQGRITEVLCEYDPASKGGNPADGRKVKGATIHWVDAANAVDAEVRLYDYLFADPAPDAPGKDFLEELNPNSLEVLTGCKVERIWMTNTSVIEPSPYPRHFAGRISTNWDNKLMR